MLVAPFWLRAGPHARCDWAAPAPAAARPGAPRRRQFVLTPSVKRHLRALARAVASGRPNVLLQGPTSAGKTSMVERLAKATGHRLIRINNHEHTDVSEYIGTFTPDADGRLVFVDGALTQSKADRRVVTGKRWPSLDLS